MAEKKTQEEITTFLTNKLPKWDYKDNHLIREYETGNWQLSLLLANSVAFIAEAAWHHPELHLSYPRVKVILQTHDAGGVTDLDFELALKIENSITWFPKDQSLPGNPKKWIQ